MKYSILIIFVIGLICIEKACSQSYIRQLLNPFTQGASYFQSFFNEDQPLSNIRRTRESKISNDYPTQLDRRAVKDGDYDSSEEDDDSDEDYDESSSSSGSVSKEYEGRLLSPSAFNKISETLGALNTVGHFIVDMTRGQDSKTDPSESNSQQAVPDAILTLTKNVLGQNVTKTIEPLIKRRISYQDDSTFTTTTTSTTQNPTAVDGKKKKNKKKKKSKVKTKTENLTTTPVPIREIRETTTFKSLISTTRASVVPAKIDVSSKEGDNRCKTPDGGPGRCEDLSSCPALLLDLSSLRDSLCFKSLFVPGVCCPISTGSTLLTTQRPLLLTTRPPQSLILLPQIRPTTTTIIPPVLGPGSNGLNNQFSNVVDPEDCGQQEFSSGRIVGGIESPNGQWPWLAAIFLHGPKKTEFWCGGSLVGTKYVLTAAHCTRDSRQKPFAARQFTVRLGDIDLSTDAEPSAPATFAVREVRAHERFSRVGFYNDIAILVLDRPVRKSKYVIPVCLPKSNLITHRERLPGRRATVVGWGTTYYGGKESTKQRQADLPIWRNEDCDRAYFQPINENFLCAGFSEGGVDACQGDSGGPLMMRIDSKWTQLGIVSFGNKCGEPGYPGVYTRISQYLDWIKDNTKE